MLTAGMRHGCDEFGVHGSDEAHDDAADDEGEDGAHGAGAGQPLTGEHDPAEADHGSEADEERIDRTEGLDEAVVSICCCCLRLTHGFLDTSLWVGEQILGRAAGMSRIAAVPIRQSSRILTVTGELSAHEVRRHDRRLQAPRRLPLGHRRS